MTNEKLVAKLRQILPEIFDTPVTLAYLFGSHATGHALPISDTDVALVLCRKNSDPPLSARDRLNLEFAVEAALEQQGIQKPDVRVIDDLPPMFRGQVAIYGIRLYARDEVARVEFETRTWKEYLDYEPVARRFREELFENIRKEGLFSDS